MILTPLTSGLGQELSGRMVAPSLPVSAATTGASALASARLFDGHMFQALARRLMRPDALTFAIAGDPTGL
jgi:hypothetical protein